MSEKNVEAIRRVYAAMARGNFWAAGEVFDPDIIWEWSTRLSGLTGVVAYHGVEGVEAATRDFFKVWDWFRQEAEEIIEVGDDVLVITRTHARLKGAEQELEGKAANVWTFRDGKVVRFKSFDSPDEAFEAVGLASKQEGSDSTGAQIDERLNEHSDARVRKPSD